MREPRLYDHDGANGRPFSSLTRQELEIIIAGHIEPRPIGDDADGDLDFAQRYAAILLKERSG